MDEPLEKIESDLHWLHTVARHTAPDGVHLGWASADLRGPEWERETRAYYVWKDELVTPRVGGLLSAVKRIDPGQREWQTPKANRGHECANGCCIRNADHYLKRVFGAYWNGDLKYCAFCGAGLFFSSSRSCLTALPISANTRGKPGGEPLPAAHSP